MLLWKYGWKLPSMRRNIADYNLPTNTLTPSCIRNGLLSYEGSSYLWRRYARSCQVVCPATEKIGPGAGTCLWYLDGLSPFRILCLSLFVWIFVPLPTRSVSGVILFNNRSFFLYFLFGHRILEVARLIGNLGRSGIVRSFMNLVQNFGATLH